MRRDDAVGALGQPLIGNVALLGEHVKPGARNGARLQGVCQRVLVNHGPARRVDQQRRRLHEGKFARADESLGHGYERAVEAHHVGRRQQLVQALRLAASGASQLLGRLRGRPDQDVHAQRLDERHHLPGDVAKEHQAAGLSYGPAHLSPKPGVPVACQDVAV